MLCYQLAHISPAAHGLFARHAGTFLIHPGLFSPDCLQTALESRAAQLLRTPEGLLPLVPILWFIERYPAQAEEFHRLEAYLALCVMRGQAAHDYPLEPLDAAALPALEDAVLRAQAGSLN
jgi:hypothetical protein